MRLASAKTLVTGSARAAFGKALSVSGKAASPRNMNQRVQVRFAKSIQASQVVVPQVQVPITSGGVDITTGGETITTSVPQ